MPSKKYPLLAAKGIEHCCPSLNFFPLAHAVASLVILPPGDAVALIRYSSKRVNEKTFLSPATVVMSFVA